MILDERTEFCDATALNTGAAGNYLLGDQIDLGAVPGQPGHGQPIYLVITVDTTVTSGGSATVNFSLVSDAAAAIATDGSATVHTTTGALSLANLAAGKMYTIAVPQSSVVFERYLGILQTTAVAAVTAGKINAFLTLDPINMTAYPNAVS